MYKCDHGHVFSEPKRIPNGGGDTGEDWFACPECGSYEIDEGSACTECGAFVPDIIGSHVVCDECLKKHMTLDEVLKYADVEERPEEVPINALLARMFTPREINTLLEREARNGYEISKMFPVVAKEYDARIAEFVGDCRDDYADWAFS